jgi:natural product precursor
MKKTKKLTLKKITIANLTESEMIQIKGGDGTGQTAGDTCNNSCGECPTADTCGYCTNDC